jgi:ribosomal protein S18 acetylase RimI-like enzyme
MTRIRPVTEADFPDVLPMVHALAAHHGDAPVATIDDLRRDTLGTQPWVQMLVAEGAGYAAMYPLVQLQFGVRGMELHHLYVADHARGLGVGRGLIAASLAQARAQGCQYMTVGTDSANAAAQAVYRAIGFEAMGEAGPRFRMKW